MIPLFPRGEPRRITHEGHLPVDPESSITTKGKHAVAKDGVVG